MRRIALAVIGWLTVVPHADAVRAQRVATVINPPSLPSPGFLSGCYATFSIKNYLLQSQSLTTSPWNAAGVGVSTPVLTANAAAAPDGTTTATKIVYPAVSGGTNQAVVYQGISDGDLTGPLSVGTTSMWIKGNVGGETLWLYNTSDGIHFYRTKVVATTQWQRFFVYNWWGGNSAPPQYTELGVDLRDAGQSGQAAQTIFAWGGMVTADNFAWPYIPTTSTEVAQTVTAACPNGTSFRDFSPLSYWVGNPVIPQNTQTYNAGGVSNPYPNGAFTLKTNGTTYAPANCTISGGSRDSWQAQCVYSSTDPLHWTNYGAGNPVLSATPSAWDDHYLLHPSIVPCSLAAYCMYYSARDSGGNYEVGIATSSDLLSWTNYGGNPLTIARNPGLPSIVKIGSTLYMYVMFDNEQGHQILYYTSPASDGVNWTFGSVAIRAPISTDWDYTNFKFYSDPYVFLNRHGFYEMVYTSNFTSGAQRISYAISADGTHWWKWVAAPILTQSSRGYAGTYDIGDGVLMERSGQFYLLWNYDNGSSISEGAADLLPDY